MEWRIFPPKRILDQQELKYPRKQHSSENRILLGYYAAKSGMNYHYSLRNN
jgi:hypothetical protein